ncbi:uncharacterized protein LOC119556824 isoform X1 [Drosophila subpulchrella]|uniref:uncharacterized protein LOC119556824 isoform X1 n=2 Tax=Drosophila subpulchrella TaxID=1486046 RepID=UPI0018A13AD4|nr:uncharacterized protein LOC119556824 isoform X1 [Drosophila subpulchrella]XP_037725206.1 uncharacterized protein LOC119556824 isoform X1 [Drosophila subpulchrella]XP_037725207.1 uncharacterized protein LOC119556824 isoform X1 [Drosophila subpulchrella]XP_037725208.1 uncharacterized protein LOC119556824 isoform X1 [Drosophila subpulchrella]
MEKKVYQDTTRPLPRVSRARYYNKHDKSDLGEDFVAPDAGWAWLVCVAAGVSNLSIYPCLQQFGFLFRERLSDLGMSSSQITAIINTNPAVSACTGLLNGPMFRRFTFRQVAMAGALLISGGIVLTAFCETFLGYMVAYALLFGFGMGISVSASSLAINTYFQQKRRRAAGFSWTITGLGPIFLPHLVTFMLTIYGVQGTTLLFAAISLHAFVCALIYQPVRYHVKPPEDQPADPEQQAEQANHLCAHCAWQQKREPGGIFSSQYLCQDDDAQRPGYEICEPGTPMLSRANDGWYGSRLSLTSGRLRFRTISSSKDLEQTQRLHCPISEEQSGHQTDEFLRPNNFRRERTETNLEAKLCCRCVERREEHNNNYNNKREREPEEVEVEDAPLHDPQMSFLAKVVTFFDLDLLRDFTFVNLVAGLTIINFGELNFSILTPFILADFGFDTPQITLAMSLLAGLDITMRFLVPFLTEKIPWDNRVFFLIGVVGIALGRTVVACTRSYSIILCSFVWIGLCKGVRTIFWPLIIPGYVPLNRLPGASGLQLLISGLFTLIGGPFVGLVRDRYNYSVTLHCLNMMSFVAAASWTVEALVRRHRRKQRLVDS